MYILLKDGEVVQYSKHARYKEGHKTIKRELDPIERAKVSFGAKIKEDGSLDESKMTTKVITVEGEEKKFTYDDFFKLNDFLKTYKEEQELLEIENLFVKLTSYSILNKKGFSYPNITAAISEAISAEGDSFKSAISILEK